MSAPLTGPELNGAWTTLAHETDFLDQISDETAMLITEVGSTVEGKPVRSVTFGDGDPTILFVGSQHGSEPSGREGLLMLARELAYSTDPATLAYLAANRVVMIPTANPDRIALNRLNANGVDLNRDHVALSEPETRAMHAVIRDVTPNAIVDMHETAHSFHEWAGPELHWYGNHSTAAGAWAATVQRGQDLYAATLNALSAQSFTGGVYETARPIGSLASTFAVLVHAAGLLGEVDRERNTVLGRSEVSYTAALGALGEHMANAALFEQSRLDSLQRAVDSLDPTPYGATGNSTPTLLDIDGYRLITPLPGHIVDLHGVTVEGDFVPINQAARLVIPYLCDPASTWKVVPDATRSMRHTAQGRIKGGWIGTPDGNWPITAGWFGTADGNRQITIGT